LFIIYPGSENKGYRLSKIFLNISIKSAQDLHSLQPVMYRRIGELPTIEQLYRDRLIQDGVLSEEASDQMISTYRDCLDKVRRATNRPAPSPVNSLQGRWEGFVFDGAEEPDTGVSADELSIETGS